MTPGYKLTMQYIQSIVPDAATCIAYWHTKDGFFFLRKPECSLRRIIANHDLAHECVRLVAAVAPLGLGSIHLCWSGIWCGCRKLENEFEKVLCLKK